MVAPPIPLHLPASHPPRGYLERLAPPYPPRSLPPFSAPPMTDTTIPPERPRRWPPASSLPAPADGWRAATCEAVPEILNSDEGLPRQRAKRALVAPVAGWWRMLSSGRGTTSPSSGQRHRTRPAQDLSLRPCGRTWAPPFGTRPLRRAGPCAPQLPSAHSSRSSTSGLPRRLFYHVDVRRARNRHRPPVPTPVLRSAIVATADVP